MSVVFLQEKPGWGEDTSVSERIEDEKITVTRYQMTGCTVDSHIEKLVVIRI
jgi:hypothetical protein